MASSRRRGTGTGVAVAWLASLAVAASGCSRKHVPVDSIPELDYPRCADSGSDEAGVSVGRGHIRAGPQNQEQQVVERFDLRRTSCGYFFRSRQEWPLAIADVEVHFDEALAPIWAWKRLTMAASMHADGNADIRRYELRTGEVFIKRRDDRGEVSFEKLLSGGKLPVPPGARVAAVVGPGRGLITAWLRRARLPVGGKVRELVLDFRDMVEKLEIGALQRDDDQFEPSLGRRVRVYTFFGKETVFADDDDVVVGDLAGMRPSDSLATPEPEPLPTYGGPDPVHTP